MAGWTCPDREIIEWDGIIKARKKLIGAASPTQDDEAASKNYVDSQISGENHWDIDGSSSEIYPFIAGIRLHASNALIDGTVSAATIFSSGNSDVKGVASSALIFSSGVASCAALYSSGNVGIGTTSPGAKLDVAGGDIYIDATQKLYLDGGSNTYIYEESADILDLIAGGSLGVRVNKGETVVNIGSVFNFAVEPTKKIFLDAGSNTYIYERVADTMGLITDGIERITIGSTGNVGIGTTGPATKLHTSGAVTFSHTPIPATPASGSIVMYASGGQLWACGDAGTHTQLAIN